MPAVDVGWAIVNMTETATRVLKFALWITVPEWAMDDERLELLQRMPVFGGIRIDILQVLLASCPVVSVPENDYFFREHEHGESMFVLETGKVHVLKAWRGQDHLLQTLNVGDCFGEMALIDHCARSASVRAVENCSAIDISTATLYRVYAQDLKQFTLIQMNMGREVCRRLREVDERLFSVRMGTLDADIGQKQQRG